MTTQRTRAVGKFAIALAAFGFLTISSAVTLGAQSATLARSRPSQPPTVVRGKKLDASVSVAPPKNMPRVVRGLKLGPPSTKDDRGQKLDASDSAIGSPTKYPPKVVRGVKLTPPPSEDEITRKPDDSGR